MTPPPGGPWVWTPLGEARGARGSWAPFGVFVHSDPDALLDAYAEATPDDPDERLPYFGSLWPSGRALALEILRGPALEGSMLDLGCGVGVGGLAAAVRGATVTFADWDPRALEAVRASAAALGLAPPRCQVLDWRADALDQRFARILASDVLYEERNLVPVACFAAAHLRPDGELWLADPGREQAGGFAPVAAAAGLHALESRLLRGAPGKVVVDLLRYGLRQADPEVGRQEPAAP